MKRRKSHEIKPVCYPFVKWAGGKSQILTEMGRFIPSNFTRYFEPFLGGGAMYFYLSLYVDSDFTAFLSDSNKELINAYTVTRDRAEELIKVLRYHQRQYNKSPSKYYYQLRDRSNFSNNIQNAARFITLNKTCYNGLYRVNKNGQFNVPIGRYKNPLICDTNNLRNVSFLLRNSKTHIDSKDYLNVLMNTQSSDFIYLDPPYSPVSSTANFTGYTNSGFSTQDQYALAEVFRKLDKKGCKILLSNSNTSTIRRLYENYFVVEVKANRAINSKASKRVGHTELLIRNYN